jgi:hypothetical protein
MCSERMMITTDTAQKVEVRASVRYWFGVPATFWWVGKDGGRFWGEGVTRDISVAGAYIFTAATPPSDMAIHLEVTLTTPDDVGNSVKLAAESRVVRIEHPRKDGARGGFAVSSKGFDIRVAGNPDNSSGGQTSS